MDLRTSRGALQQKPVQYRVIQYAADGSVISEELVSAASIELTPSGVTWVDARSGLSVSISGTVSVREV